MTNSQSKTNYLKKELDSMKDYKIIPQEKEFNVKAISDLVYGYMQINSYKGKTIDGEEISFIYKTPTLVSEISKETKIAVRTVRNKINKLLKTEFIREEKVIDLYDKEVEAYAFKSVELYQKIDLETLRFLVASANENVIKVYCYLLGKCANVNPQYEFSKKELMLNCLGVKSTTHKKDYETIDFILINLENNGLLELCDKKVKLSVGNGLSTYYYKVYKIHAKFKRPEHKEISSKSFGTVKTKRTREFLEKLDNGEYEEVEF